MAAPDLYLCNVQLEDTKLKPLSDANRPLLDSPAPTIETVAYSLIIGAVVVLFLYFGREILIPLALASLLSFVLWPLITALRNAHVGRASSVLAAVALTIAGLV